MKTCVMCGKESEEKALDFLGRCDDCFRKFMDMPEIERPKLSIPFTPVSKAVK